MPETNPPQTRRSQRILARLLGAVLALAVVTTGTFILLRRQAVPELTPQLFAQAEENWGQVAPANYTIDTQVSGMQPATYRVEVQNHRVVIALRNGNALKDKRTLGTWSVPGMFDTIRRDLETNADAPPRAVPLHLRASFESDFGYPQRYVRLMWGTKVTTSWEVVHFESGNTSGASE